MDAFEKKFKELSRKICGEKKKISKKKFIEKSCVKFRPDKKTVEETILDLEKKGFLKVKKGKKEEILLK